jgi:hypothetical protein
MPAAVASALSAAGRARKPKQAFVSGAQLTGFVRGATQMI